MTQKIIFTLFSLITLFFFIFIIKLFLLNDKANYEMEIKETVLEINNVRGRPLQRTAKLSNEKSIAVPFEFISSIQIGDSILKYKNSNKYTLKSKNNLKSITTKN